MGIGHHEAAWRAPESSVTATWEVQHYVELAQIAERGPFDSIFFADGPSLQGDLRYRPVAWLDPLIILPAVAAAVGRDRIDHLQRAVQLGAALRIARPCERWACRLEHRDDRWRRSRPELWAGRRSAAQSALRARQ